MTKQELKNTYEAMSMPEERVSALENRLLKLFDGSAGESEDYENQGIREFRIEPKKHSKVKIIAAAVSAAAAVGLCVVGGNFLLNNNIVPEPPVSEITEPTREAPTSEPDNESTLEASTLEASTLEASTLEASTLEAPPESVIFDDSIPLPNLYSDFEMNFDLFEPFNYYWYPDNGITPRPTTKPEPESYSYYDRSDYGETVADLICIGSKRDIFGSVHGYEHDTIPDMYCGGFCEDEQGWYMRGSNRNGGDSIYFIPKNDDSDRMYRYDFGTDAAPKRSEYNVGYIRQGEAEWFNDPFNDGGFYSVVSPDRAPAENYVGQISWLGKEKLCLDYGENWAAEFNKWYNMGGTIEYNGNTYNRIPQDTEYTTDTENSYFGGKVFLISHNETSFVAAFRFFNVNGIGRYFILTAEYNNGAWSERWQAMSAVDAMMMQGKLAPTHYNIEIGTTYYEVGTEQYYAIHLDSLSFDGSELFSYNMKLDEFTLFHSYLDSAYLKGEDCLYAAGTEAVWKVTDGNYSLVDYTAAENEGFINSTVVSKFQNGKFAAQSEYIDGHLIADFALRYDDCLALTMFGLNGNRLYVLDKDTLELIDLNEQPKSEKQYSFPASEYGKTDTKSEIFAVDPFKLEITLPSAWREEIPEKYEGTGITSENSPIRLMYGGSKIAEIDFNIFDPNAGDNYRAVYNQIMNSAKSSWDCDYTVVNKTESSETAVCKIMRADVNYDDYRKGILAYNRDLGVYITIAFEYLNMDDELLRSIAESIVISSDVQAVQPVQPEWDFPEPQKGYYDDVFEEIDSNPITVGPPGTYEELMSVVANAQEHYGGTAAFWLCRTVRALSESEANKYSKTAYEVILEENLLTGEKSGERAIVVTSMGSPKIQTKGDPIYSPNELFACALVENNENGCMQQVGWFRYDIERDGTALSRGCAEIDALMLEGAENISEDVICSTTKNPAHYTQKLPLSSLVEFFKKDWATRLKRPSDEEFNDIKAIAEKAAKAYLSADREALSALLADPNYDAGLPENSINLFDRLDEVKDIRVTYSGGVFHAVYQYTLHDMDMIFNLEMSFVEINGKWLLNEIYLQG